MLAINTTAVLVDLHKQILQNPDETTLRLIYADALQDEIGDNDVSEFIRCQCELHGDKYNVPLQNLVYGLLPRLGITRYKRELTSGSIIFDTSIALGYPDIGLGTFIPNWDTSYSYRRYERGFVSFIQSTSRWWLDNGDAEVKRNPITDIVIEDTIYRQSNFTLSDLSIGLHMNLDVETTISTGSTLRTLDDLSIGDPIYIDRGNCIRCEPGDVGVGIALESVNLKEIRTKRLIDSLNKRWPTVTRWSIK